MNSDASVERAAPRPPSFDNRDDYKRAREVFETSNYTDRGIVEALGLDKNSPLRTSDPNLIRRTVGGSRLETLVRLFLLSVPVEVEAARRAVQPMDLEPWVNAGLIHVRDGWVTAHLRLTPFKHLVLAHDFQRASSATPPDFVMGVGAATRTLSSTTIRKRCNLALDLGTGSGVLAFLACQHSDRVYALDRNTRAIDITRFNARMNDITNVECREGNLFEPVKGLEFDLVVTDPPFVISPPSGFLYLHGGMRGDQFCRTIARDAPRFLKEGGYFQMLFNWAHYAGQDSVQDLAGWFEGTGCDAWVLRVSTEDAPAYATSWTQHIHGDDRNKANHLFHQWMDYYETEGIKAISLGLVTMQRCSKRPNWISIEDAPPKVKDDCGADIEARFDSCDYLATHDDAALLDATLRCSPYARLEYRCEPDSHEWRMADSELRLDRSLSFSCKTDPFTAGLLVRCDGQTPLRDLLPEFANAVGTDLGSVTLATLKAARQLLERGFLLRG